jgi:DNA-binding CsgD family transcriptional regulator
MIAPVLSKTVRLSPMGQESSHMSAIIEACGLGNGDSTGPDTDRNDHGAGLTPRESEILKFMAAGYRNSEIAEKAFISLDTVKAHGKHIFEKLGVKTRVQAVRMAEERHLLD